MQINIELSEEEVLQSLSSDDDVISVKRIKKMDKKGSWVESEIVRLRFQKPYCPSYAHAYGCRFEVERFVFPVTQCSRCWKFGHFRRFCSLKKDLCPKCGNEHGNCESVEFTCPNCKGAHMALNKTCPSYLKEKEIRIMMSKENITYREAFHKYLKEKKGEEQKKEEREDVEMENLLTPGNPSISRTYSEVLKNTDIQETSNSSEDEVKSIEHSHSQKTNKKKRMIPKKTKIVNIPMEETTNVMVDTSIPAEDPKKRKKNIFEFKRLWRKMKDIILGEDKLENKVVNLVRLIIEECKEALLSVLSEGDIFKTIFNIYNG